MQSPRSRRVGDDKERRQKGFLPDFRDAIKAARGHATSIVGTAPHAALPRRGNGLQQTD